MRKQKHPGRRWYPQAVEIKTLSVRTTRAKGFLRDLERLCKRYAKEEVNFKYMVKEQ